MFILIKDGVYVKVKFGVKMVIVNGKFFDLLVFVVMKEGKVWVFDIFINDVFQFGFDQIFQVEKCLYLLNLFLVVEISEVVIIVKVVLEFQLNICFIEIFLYELDKVVVWVFVLQGMLVDVFCIVDVVMFDGKYVIEVVVDL